MADIFCQVCGTLNPSGSENCQFCGAKIVQQPDDKDETGSDIRNPGNSKAKPTNSMNVDKPGDLDHTQKSGNLEDSESSQRENINENENSPWIPENVEDTPILKENPLIGSQNLSNEPVGLDDDGENADLSSEVSGVEQNSDSKIVKEPVDDLEDTPVDFPEWLDQKGNQSQDDEENSAQKEVKSGSDSEIRSEKTSVDATIGDTAADSNDGVAAGVSNPNADVENLPQLDETYVDDASAADVPVEQKQTPDELKDDDSSSRPGGAESEGNEDQANKDWLDRFGTFGTYHETGNEEVKDQDDNETPDGDEIKHLPSDHEQQNHAGEHLEASQEELAPSFGRSWSEWEKILPNEEKEIETAEKTASKKEVKKRSKSSKGKKSTSVKEKGGVTPLEEKSAAEQPSEDYGPLAGLQGILPGREKGDYVTVPPVYSRSLHLSDAQRAQMNLLENILAEEDQPGSYLPQRTRKNHRLAQIIFSIIVLVLLSLPIFLNTRFLILPEVIPVYTNNFYEIINNTLTEPGAPVLIAAEFEPGFAGEMNVAALPVIDQLMKKEADLTIISTFPTGPALAQSLIDQAHKRNPDYSLEQNTISLGYLAGNANALQEFALQPQQAAKYALNSMDMWGRHPALNGINNLGDYAIIIIMTNNIDQAKMWLEQVQPLYAGSVHILFVASAQTAPVLSPYIDSGQIEGMVAGYAGGVAYEQLTQSPIKGRIYWDSFQVGIALTAIIVLLGAIYQVFSASFKHGVRVRRP